jgi:HEPN domain
MSELTTDERTTALGLFNYARSYRASADYLLSAKLQVPHAHAPLTFLYYHAVELYLKAYLRVQGYTVAQLKSVSHNVSKLSTEVQSRGLILDDEDKEVLSSIAEGDNVIRSRYIQIGAFTRPEEEALSPPVCPDLIYDRHNRRRPFKAIKLRDGPMALSGCRKLEAMLAGLNRPARDQSGTCIPNRRPRAPCL